MKIYLAGPLFTHAELVFNATVAAGLRARGHEVFLPQEQEQQHTTPQAIFESDVGGIDWAEALVGCMDGADPDSGTCWEVGYAYRKKPIVLFRTDGRREGPPLGPYNLMMTQSADDVLDLRGADVERIASRIDRALTLMAEGRVSA